MKVLFICNEWTEKDKNEIVDGYWNYIIDDFAESNLLTGNFCILIAEWNEKLAAVILIAGIVVIGVAPFLLQKLLNPASEEISKQILRAAF